MQEKKLPLGSQKIQVKRQCAGCRASKEKKELLRIVRSAEGVVSLDTTGKKPGRGAYICADVSCLEKAMKTKALERGLGTPVSPETYESLRKEINHE